MPPGGDLWWWGPKGQCVMCGLLVPGGRGYPDNEPPYGSRSHMPYGQDGPHNMYEEDEMGPHGLYENTGPRNLYENTGPRDMYDDSKAAFSRDFDEEPREVNAALQQYPYEGQGPRNLYEAEEDGQPPHGVCEDDTLPYNRRGYFDEESPRGELGALEAPPLNFDPNRRSPSIDSETRGMNELFLGKLMSSRHSKSQGERLYKTR